MGFVLTADTAWFRSGKMAKLFSREFVYRIFLDSDASQRFMEVITVDSDTIAII